jgi:hypothetical protein
VDSDGRPSAATAGVRRRVLLLIDVEPDERKPTPGVRDGWSGTRVALPVLQELRDVLARRTCAAVRFNWFLRLDPQIRDTWDRVDHVARVVPQLADVIAAHDDASGIHPHLWRWSAADRDWYNDLEDVSWMEHCLDTAIDGHRAIFGRAPEACRFGDRWRSDAAVAALRARGIRYDLSVEPGRPDERPLGDRRARGRLPDTHAEPRVPYRASSDDPARGPAAGLAATWIVPVTTSSPRWQPTHEPPFVVRASVSANLALSSLLVGPLLDRELARDDPAPLVLVLRSGDLASRRRRRNVERNAARLLAHPGVARSVFTTTPDAIGAFAACTGDR